MRPFSSIRKQSGLRSSSDPKVTLTSAARQQPIPLRPTQILPAMDIGLQILAGMDPKEARRIYRSQKNER